MKHINRCGKCNSVPVSETYFNLKTSKERTLIRCLHYQEEVESSTPSSATRKWNYRFPKLFD